MSGRGHLWVQMFLWWTNQRWNIWNEPYFGLRMWSYDTRSYERNLASRGHGFKPRFQAARISYHLISYPQFNKWSISYIISSLIHSPREQVILDLSDPFSGHPKATHPKLVVSMMYCLDRGNDQSNHFPHIPGKITWYWTRLSTVNHRRSSPIFFPRAGGCTQAIKLLISRGGGSLKDPECWSGRRRTHDLPYAQPTELNRSCLETFSWWELLCAK